MTMTTLEIQVFETKVNTLVDEALTARGYTRAIVGKDKPYLREWFSGTLFIQGIKLDDMIAVKNVVETFTDMQFSKVGKTDEFAIDFV